MRDEGNLAREIRKFMYDAWRHNPLIEPSTLARAAARYIVSESTCARVAASQMVKEEAAIAKNNEERAKNA